MTGNKKRYYWLKLKNDFFEQKEIKMLRRIAGGDTYTIIYLKMLLRSLENNGLLYFESVGNDFIDEIALDLDEETENVSITLQFLQSKGLLEIVEDDEYFLNRVPEMVGSEAYSTERSRRSRANKKEPKVLHCNTDATPLQHDATKSIEIENRDKRKEIEKDAEEGQQPSIYPAELIQNLYGKFPTGILQSALSGWMKEWPREMVCYAIQTSYDYGKEINALKPYINRIFENWKLANIDTLEKAVKADNDFKQRQKKPQRQPIRKEVVPERYNEPYVEKEDPELMARMQKAMAEYQASKGVTDSD